MALEPKGMLNAGAVVLLNVSVGWLPVTGAEAVRVPPKPLKLDVLLLLLGAVWAALGRDWPKVATAVEAGMAGGLPNWNMGPTAGVKLAPEAGGVPKRKGWEAEVVVLVTLPRVLVTVHTPKLNAGFGAESAEVLAVVMDTTAEVALAWPLKRGALVLVAGVAVCLKEKGVNMGMDAGGPMLLKIGLKVRGGLLVVVGMAELEDAAAVTLEGPEGKGPSFSLLGGTTKMGLNMGDAEDTAGATEAGGLAGGVLSIPNRILCLGLGDGADGAWDLADVSA